MYGFGEYINSYDASCISLGDAKFFNGSNKDLILSSPSTFSIIDYSNLSMSIAFNSLETSSADKLTSNNFHFASIFVVTIVA